jgi:hypothetical protein
MGMLQRLWNRNSSGGGLTEIESMRSSKSILSAPLGLC